MRHGITAVIVGMILIVSLVEPTKAEQISRNFLIETWQINEKNEKIKILAGAEHSSIDPIGRGAATDLECEGVSADNGVLNCIVKKCDESDSLANTYLVNFNPPFLYGQVRPAIIRVAQCKVMTPKPIIAGFLQRKIISKFSIEDQKYLFNKTTSVPTAKLVEGVSPENYSKRLIEIIKKPLGVSRVIILRRFIQDASFNALEKKDTATAVAYQRLMTAYANVMLKYSAEKISPKSKLLNADGTLTTLYLNIDLTEKELARLEKEASAAAQAASHPSYSVLLKKLRHSTKKGKLANKEFKQLEKLAMSAQLYVY